MKATKIGSFFHIATRVGRSAKISGLPNQREIINIISHVSCFIQGKIEFFADRMQRIQFSAAFHSQVIYMKLIGPCLNHRRFTASNKSHFIPQLPYQVDYHTILRIKYL